MSPCVTVRVDSIPEPLSTLHVSITCGSHAARPEATNAKPKRTSKPSNTQRASSCLRLVHPDHATIA
jgi:hypothetical protein